MTTPRTVLILAAAIAASGCSVMRRHEARDTGDLLIAAGFRPKLTDTPARAEQLSAMPPLEMVSESNEGHVVYRYADPYSCDCLYVGDEDAYREYERLTLQKKIADEQLAAAERDGDAWDPWLW